MQLNVQLTLALTLAPDIHVLNLAAYIHSPDHSTIGTRSHFDVLSVLVSTRFQVLFHSPPGVLFTFPSRYLSAIGHQGVFRLTRWSWQIRTGFLGPRATWDPLQAAAYIPVTGLTPSTAGLSNPFTYAPALTSPIRQNRYGKSRNPSDATPAGYHTPLV